MMATKILQLASNASHTHQYRLAEPDRQKILASTPSAILRQRIEQQRLKFIQKNGDAFGAFFEHQNK